MENLFAYGTLQQPTVQTKVFGRVSAMQGDMLLDYHKDTVQINGTTYPIAVPKPGAFINGHVLSVTPKEVALMDDYETAAYKRIKVTLASGVKAWAYCRP